MFRCVSTSQSRLLGCFHSLLPLAQLGKYNSKLRRPRDCPGGPGNQSPAGEYRRPLETLTSLPPINPNLSPWPSLGVVLHPLGCRVWTNLWVSAVSLKGKGGQPIPCCAFWHPVPLIACAKPISCCANCGLSSTVFRLVDRLEGNYLHSGYFLHVTAPYPNE